MKPKILIVYIATKGYNRFFSEFKMTLDKYFCPDCDKTIIRFTDDIELATNKVRSENVIYKYVRHYPWPIVTLMKYLYIKEAIDEFGEGYTHVIYFNANVKFRDVIKFDDYLCWDKLTATYHYAWTKINKNFVKLGNLNYRSLSFIDEPYTYVQAGFTAGPINMVSDMCDTINEWTQVDLARYIIPKCHDESYYNKYIHEMSKLDKVRYLNEYYNGDETDEYSMTTFNPCIVTRDKKDLDALKEL